MEEKNKLFFWMACFLLSSNCICFTSKLCASLPNKTFKRNFYFYSDKATYIVIPNLALQ